MMERRTFVPVELTKERLSYLRFNWFKCYAKVRLKEALQWFFNIVFFIVINYYPQGQNFV